MAFSYYRTITIDKTKVPNTNQTDFPVLVSGTYSYLETVANGGEVTNASGYDIGFYSDSALTTKLKWETERYIATTGEVVYWVKVPTVSTSVDTVIYMAYGDAAITTDQSDKVNVWDSGYKGVWHLPDGTTLTANDSTSNGENGTLVNTPTVTAGKIGGGANFVRTSSESITIDNFTAQMNSITTYTMSTWFKAVTVDSNRHIIGPRNADASDAFYMLQLGNTTNVEMRFRNSAGTATTLTATSAVPTGTWKYLSLVYDGSNLRAYVDGAQVTSGAASGSFSTTDRTFRIGAGDASPFNYLSGDIDEARMSLVARSADWNATEYNNQNSPSTFYTVGSQTTPGGGARTDRMFFGA